MNDLFLIILIFAFVGLPVLIIFNRRIKLPDPNKMKDLSFKKTHYSNDLSFLLDESLKQLNKNETAAKRRTNERKNFIKKHYKIIASFYNNYRFIDYTKKENRKIAKKQMLQVINVLGKNLEIMEDYFNNNNETSSEINYHIILVGIITFKMMTKETLNKVNKDLKKLYDLNQKSDLPDELLTSIERILTPLGYFD